MKRQSENKTFHLQRLKTIGLLVIICSAIGIFSSAFENKMDFTDIKNTGTINKDSIESVQAFMQVYKVLMSPRCMNCHPAGDVPLQGDDSHIHSMLPKRGKDGRGVYALKCANCHQPENLPGLHKPPGNPNWHLPPADMKMVFQGKSPAQLAKQIIDPAQNGNKSKAKLLEHAYDALVLAGWNMGQGRTAPPMSHEEFVKVWTTWIKKGAYAPK